MFFNFTLASMFSSLLPNIIMDCVWHQFFISCVFFTMEKNICRRHKTPHGPCPLEAYSQFEERRHLNHMESFFCQHITKWPKFENSLEDLHLKHSVIYQNVILYITDSYQRILKTDGKQVNISKISKVSGNFYVILKCGINILFMYTALNFLIVFINGVVRGNGNPKDPLRKTGPCLSNSCRNLAQNRWPNYSSPGERGISIFSNGTNAKGLQHMKPITHSLLRKENFLLGQ